MKVLNCVFPRYLQLVDVYSDDVIQKIDCCTRGHYLVRMLASAIFYRETFDQVNFIFELFFSDAPFVHYFGHVKGDGRSRS